ncbi:2'-phosphodiesterase [Capsaspora owczarzaki ATCC 30864]|uniref:2'-phosphodiesterase n=1 Tax=Capsaspora owczarzaki (strain ATCC 30864) TaxID=595528 RepID=A0A0D2UI58_CAPO3|nr:2'-phosphodiesterase [Capsaspora owczarzaki ATCC 30864]KJE94811.1 2'-phosphodiesterase [Capsaspora owczarzaki ATCC 30864]|eukprot:XP_004347073.1 2'-phosphodiesterase [Capsaspora owczarzaki ATCC 30864]
MSASTSASASTFASTPLICVVRRPAAAGSSQVGLALDYGGVAVNMTRQADETIERTFERLTRTIQSSMSKRDAATKGKGGSATSPATSGTAATLLTIDLLDAGAGAARIAPTTTNGDAWQQGQTLVIGSTRFDVVLNPPLVTQLTLCEPARVGLPLVPVASFENCARQDATWSWHRVAAPTPAADAKKSASKQQAQLPTTKPIATSQVYLPVPEDLDHLLQCVCTPKNAASGAVGQPATVLLTKVVAPTTPSSHPIPHHLLPTDSRGADNRVSVLHQHTQPPPPPPAVALPSQPIPANCLAPVSPLERSAGAQLRVVTYNILADVYADSDYARTVLYPYCAPFALKLDYRRQMIARELQRFDGDLVCLQEVERKQFQTFFEPFMESLGFLGLFRCKTRSIAEGSAMFFRRSQFSLVSSHDVALNERWKTAPHCAKLARLLETHSGLQAKFEELSTVAQISVLHQLEHPTGSPARFVIAANTHLYFHPKANNFRLMQMSVILSEIESAKAALREQHPHARIAVVFCGDFNSWSDRAACKLATMGSIPASHEDWDFLLELASGEENEDASSSSSVNASANTARRLGVDLDHGLHLVSVCGDAAYTNYVGGFNACLDHIFVDSHELAVTSVLPMPSHHEVTTNRALPSVVFPSDHLALVADFRWTE